MDEVIFISVAFGDQRYIDQQIRLEESIKKFYPKANIRFWTNYLPDGAKSMETSLYGFKVHAVAEVRKYFKKVIFLDPAMILVDKIDDLLKFEMMAVKDDNKLHNLVSDRCYQFYKLTREEVLEEAWHLVGGSIYYFDFNTEVANRIFDTWFEAERLGLFGSQREQASELLQGHRMDEACMALAMYFNDLEPTSMHDARYCTENNPMFIKKHFK